MQNDPSLNAIGMMWLQYFHSNVNRTLTYDHPLYNMLGISHARSQFQQLLCSARLFCDYLPVNETGDT